MYLEERLEYILNKIKAKGRVNVADLSQELEVSEVTIRKDLKILEDQMKLKRTFGGAIDFSYNVKVSSISEKKIDKIIEKKKIAKDAAKLIQNNMAIFMDAGTTTFEIIEHLTNFENLTVITNDLLIGAELAKFDHISTYILGGFVEHKTISALSIEAYDILDKFHADICFIGTDAFDQNHVYSTNSLKSNLKRKMIERSKIRVLVADSSKYSRDGLFSFYKTKDFDYVITDRKNADLNSMLDSD